ncbi:MAG TPA: porin [Nevskiaceae bacterium]|nr:porin [Nevskiaceae bacterium]
MQMQRNAMVLAVLGLFSAPALAQTSLPTIPVEPVRAPADEPFPWKIKTQGGLTVESADGRNKITLDGRIQFDAMMFDGLYNDANDGADASDTRIRRARLGIGGTIDQDWDFTVVFETLDDTRQSNVYQAQLTYTGFDVFDITGGRFKRPFALEEISSSNWISTIERSIATDLTANNIAQSGLMLSQVYDTAHGPVSWYASVQEDGLQNANGRDQYGYYARGAWAPLHGKEQTLHLGLAVAELSLPEDFELTLGTRLGVSAAQNQTLAVVADDDRQYGLEAAWIRGPLSVQAEYVNRTLGEQGGDTEIEGGYLQATFTLTGESREYKKYPARIDRIKPANARYGAVELVAKLEQVDVRVNGAAEQTVNLTTVGANWYLNQNLRLMLNVLSADGDELGTTQADGNAVSARFQFTF